MTESMQSTTMPTLSDPERRLLHTALEAGYFECPRGTTLGDIAAIHDISDREASQRMRSGLEVVLRETLAE